jgi:transcriptional regulator with XRE-family HTH domain
VNKHERTLAARIAAGIRRLRLAKGESQEALAERVGVATNYVSMIERASCLPSLGVLLKLADALGADVGEVVGGAAPPDDEGADAARIVRALPAAERSRALAVLRSLSGVPGAPEGNARQRRRRLGTPG